jgi:hypothetical protein
MHSGQQNKDKKKDGEEDIDNIVSEREKTHQKMELWSNAYENEYALRLAIASADDDYGTLGDSFLARTDPNVRYTNVVAESDCLEDFKDGSEYTKASDRTLQRSTTATTKRRISVEK